MLPQKSLQFLLQRKNPTAAHTLAMTHFALYLCNSRRTISNPAMSAKTLAVTYKP